MFVSYLTVVGRDTLRSSKPQHWQRSPKLEWNRSGVALLSSKAAMSLKRGKIEPRLLLITNRKLHTRIRLVPKSITLDDLERTFRTLFQNTYAFSKIWIKIVPYYQRQRCSAIIAVRVPGNIRFTRTFAGLSWRRGVKRQWGNRKRRLLVLTDAMSSES